MVKQGLAVHRDKLIHPKPQMQYPDIEPAVKSQSKWFRKSARTEYVSVLADFMI